MIRLFSELKVLDKEHLALKRLKADNNDKDGLREAEIRKKVCTIPIPYIMRRVFLNRGNFYEEALDFLPKKLGELSHLF